MSKQARRDWMKSMNLRPVKITRRQSGSKGRRQYDWPHDKAMAYWYHNGKGD